VTNPQATGWGETWNGRPVVRLALYADNLTVGGWLALPQTQPTNLVIRLVCSNDVILAQEVWQ